MIVEDILATTYILLDNITEEELDRAVALEQLGSVLQQMEFERLLSNLNDFLIKDTIVFTDGTGIKPHTLTNFGHPVYLKMNEYEIEECPVGMLDIYATEGLQRVAFWSDADTDGSREGAVKYAQLGIPINGTLKVWYEPDKVPEKGISSDIDFNNSLRYCIATRHAKACLPYVKYRDEYKSANKPILAQLLISQADNWERIYLEKINRIGTDRPFSRVPFGAR